jgi:S1-C subfamily serine protease
VDDVTSDAAKRLNIKETEGVVITKIEAGSAAAKAGLMTGQIILRINNLPVNTPEEFRLTLDGQIDAMSKADRNTITLYIKDRNNNYRYVVLRFDSPKEEE